MHKSLLAVCLSLLLFSGMPTVADAFFGSKSDKQLSGLYIDSDQQERAIPSDFIEFSGGTYTATMSRAPATLKSGTEKGKYSISGDAMEFVSSDGKTRVYKFSRTENTITLNDGRYEGTFVRATKKRVAAIEENVRKAEEARKEKIRKLEEAFKAAGFIAVSGSSMNWNDAKAFCQQKGGRLPRINNSGSYDGFGAQGAPWPSGLPTKEGYYWTDIEKSGYPADALVVHDSNGKVFVGYSRQFNFGRAACVPLKTAHEAEEIRKAEEATRKAEEARKAEAAIKAAGFIAVAPSPMNWNDAKAFCQQKGGKLPHINNRKSFTRSERDKIIDIDGFGAEGRPWAEVGLPSGYEYWTGTEYSDNPRHSWFVYARDGKVFVTDGVGHYNRFNNLHVACVPPLTAHEAEKMRNAEDARKAEEARAAKAAGFIVLSDNYMSWNDAKAFCRQHGGRLPRINNSGSFAWSDRDKSTHIDGFGTQEAPWPEGLPGYDYWTGTENSGNPGSVWVVGLHKGGVGLFFNPQSNDDSNNTRAVCVP